MKFLICGDTIVTNKTVYYFDTKNLIDLVGDELYSIMTSGDYDIICANLEAPLTNTNNKIIKNGPHLKSPPSCSKGLADLGINLVSLANNHINDFGEEGIRDTVLSLESVGINYLGIVGNDFNKKSVVFSISGFSVGFYSLCENEFSTNSNQEICANGLCLDRNINDIKELKKQVDYLVVLFHGGKELYRYPTPFEQKVCRTFVDCGADYVVAQHSHCVGCMEKYKNKTIIYGQGNFLFGKSNPIEYSTSLLISISIDQNFNVHEEFIPISAENEKIRFSNDRTIIDGFMERTLLIKDENMLHNLYDKECEKYRYYLLYCLLNKSRFYQLVDSHLFNHCLLKRYIKRHKAHLPILLNLIECETHNEMIKNLLKKELNKKN